MNFHVILKVQIVVLGEVGGAFFVSAGTFLKWKDICDAEKSMQELFQGYIPQISLFSRPKIHILNLTLKIENLA